MARILCLAVGGTLAALGVSMLVNGAAVLIRVAGLLGINSGSNLVAIGVEGAWPPFASGFR